MVQICMVLSGDWRCSNKSEWEFYVDKERLSRVLSIDESFNLMKLKQTVLKEFGLNETSTGCLTLSFWPLNVEGFVTNTKTPPVMLTNDASVAYFISELVGKNCKNLFVRFNLQVTQLSEAPKLKKKPGGDSESMGYTTPVTRSARVVNFDLNIEASPIVCNDVDIPTVGSKCGPGFLNDDEIISFIEEEEAREKSGSFMIGDLAKGPWDLGLDSESSDEDIDMEDVVPSPGFDTEFWEPLLEEPHGGSNAPDIVWGCNAADGQSEDVNDDYTKIPEATSSCPSGLSSNPQTETPKRVLADVDVEEFDIPPLFDDREFEFEDIPDLDRFDENELIVVGKVFRCRQDLQIFLALHAIKNMFYWVQSRTTLDHVVFSCTDTLCHWRVTAKEIKGCGYYKIKTTYLNHSCSLETRSKYKKKATSKVIAAVYKAKYGSPGGAPLAMQLQQMVLEDLGVDASYMKCYRAGEKATASVWGTDEESYEKLPTYFHLLQIANPGTVTDIQTELCDDGVERYKYSFLSFGASIRGFKLCRRVLVVDGTHLFGKYKGVLLTASAQDANFQVYPIAFGVVDSENDDSWTWFMRRVEKIVGDSNELTIISDRCQSIYKAVDECFPKAHHGACIVHLERNIVTKFKNKGLSKLVGQAAFAYKIGEFDAIWDRIVHMNENCAKWLEKIKIRHWARSSFEGKRYNMMTSNIAESLNSALRKGRSCPIVELYRFIQAMMTRWFGARRKKSLKHRGGVTIEVEKVMANNRAAYVGSKVNRIDNYTFEVIGIFGGRSTVRLRTRKCSCKAYDMLEIPCGHAMLAADSANVSDPALVPHIFRTPTWATLYEGVVIPAIDEKLVIFPRTLPILKFAPPTTKWPAGRRKETRILSAGEIEKTKLTKGSRAGYNKCGRCHRVGHNRTSCSFPI